MQITIHAKGPNGTVEIMRTATGVEILAINDGGATTLCEVASDANESDVYEAAEETARLLYGSNRNGLKCGRDELRAIAALINQVQR